MEKGEGAALCLEKPLLSFFHCSSDFCMCGSLQVSLFSPLHTETTSQNRVKTIIACFLSPFTLLPLIVRRALDIKLSSQARAHTHVCAHTHAHAFILAAGTLFSCRCEGHPPGPFHEALPFLSVCSRPFIFNRSTSRTPLDHWREREAPPHTSFTC